MSSSEDNPNIHELSARSRKQQGNTSWRDQVVNRGFNTDDLFRTIQRSKAIKEKNDITIPDSLQDITTEQARSRGLDEAERMRRNRDFAIRRQRILETRRS
jgi:hypothetical protein